MRASYGLGLAGLGAAAALASPWQAEGQAWRFHADHVLGTSLDLAVMAKDPLTAARAMDAARSEIARLDPVLSAWRGDSELTVLNTAPVHAASPDLFAVIAACEDWRRRTGGAFSARLGRALAACGSPGLAASGEDAALELNPVTRTITRPDSVVFAVDGLAKGYIIDRALEAARCIAGVDGVMMDIGGDLRCWGKAPQTRGWRIGLVDAADPSDNAPSLSHLKLNDMAVATSGRSSRNQLIISPLSGAAVDHVAYATAVAPSAMDADALATAFSVLPVPESLALADRLPQVAARIIGADGKIHASSRWQDYCAESPPQRLAQAAPANGPAWPNGFIVLVEYEVPQIATGSYHSPVVAIWITDENRNLVRTLLVLGYRNRYREEAYVYWRRFGRLNEDLADSVTKPTRPPGRYSIKWDGLDDTGKKVPQGKYILNIEASREKGGHSVQRLELNLGAGVSNASADAMEEIGDVRASYGRGG
jgi:thiamine biosynthesis lipoprotein